MGGMIGIYWGTFLFGGILIASSIFLGGGDGDMDKDVSFDKDFSLDVDGEAGGDFDSMGWLPFLSLRFWTFFLGLFGLSGILLTGMESGSTVTLVTSGFLGVGMAYPISYLFQHLKKESVTSNTSSESYTQEMATTLLPFRPNGQGKIRVSSGGELIDIIANNPTSHNIEQDAEVLIVSMDDGIATISPVLRITKE